MVQMVNRSRLTFLAQPCHIMTPSHPDDLSCVSYARRKQVHELCILATLLTCCLIIDADRKHGRNQGSREY